MDTSIKKKGGFKGWFGRTSDTNLLLTITIVIFFIMYICAIVFQGGGFLKPQTFFNILNDNAALIITACGLSLVMISGGIDISVGGVMALTCTVCGVYLDKDILNPDKGLKPGNVFIAMLIAVGIGLAFGVVQGFLVAYLDIQPFIITLAGMFLARGLSNIVHTEHFNIANKAFKELKQTRITVPGMGTVNNKGIYMDAHVEIGVIVAIVIVIALFFMLRKAKLGRNFYAVGGNSQSALMLGINVKRTRFLAHVMCGVLAGVAGYVYLMRVGSSSSTNAEGFEMNAIASAIIGGTMLTGGVGNVVGTLFGVLSLMTIQNIVTSAGLGDAWWTGIARATMLCLFLLLQSVVMSQKKKILSKG